MYRPKICEQCKNKPRKNAKDQSSQVCLECRHFPDQRHSHFVEKKPYDLALVHFVKEGDSLFGMSKTACGVIGKDSVGSFFSKDVTCGACMRTKFYKDARAGKLEDVD